MTDLTHDPILDEARKARLEQLQSRRGGSNLPPPTPTPRSNNGPIAGTPRLIPAPTGRTSGERRKRPHPAQGSRIAAVGIGMATMLGLVGVMGFASHQAGAQSSNDSAGPDGTPALVLAHDDTTGDTSGDTSAADGSTTDGSAADSPASSIHTTTKSSASPSLKTNTKTIGKTTVKPKTTTKPTAKPKTIVKPKVTVAPKPPVTTTPKATTHGSR